MFKKILSHLSHSSLFLSSPRFLVFKTSLHFSNPPQSSSSTTSSSSSSPPQFSKDLYLKQLTSDREELEKERSEGIDSAVQYSKRKSREQEVLTSSIDFAQISLQNLSLFPSEFRHPDELRYYVGSVKFRLTEENLLKCLNGYIKFAPQLAQGLFELDNSNNQPLDSAKEAVRNENHQEIDKYNQKKHNNILEGSQKVFPSEESQQKSTGSESNDANEIKLSTPLSSSDLSSFSSFILLLRNHFPSSSSASLLISAALFGDLYCVGEKGGYWEGLERKVLFMREKLKIDDFLIIFGCFARQKEGSEFFYERSEETIENGWNALGIEGLVGIMKCFYRVRLGTTRFVLRLLEKMEERLGEAGKECLIDFFEVYVHSSYVKEEVVGLVEEKFLKMLEGLSIVDMGRIASAFGTYRGSPSLFAILEKRIIGLLTPEAAKIQTRTKLDSVISLEELKMLLAGFMYTSRGSKPFFESLKPFLLLYLDELTTIEHSKLFKVVSMSGYQKEKGLQNYLEKKMVDRLKQVKEISVEEIMEIVKSTCTSRQGSREMFKLMELVVGYKLEEICKNSQVGMQIYRYYEHSGLCSSELILKMERKLVD